MKDQVMEVKSRVEKELRRCGWKIMGCKVSPYGSAYISAQKGHDNIRMRVSNHPPSRSTCTLSFHPGGNNKEDLIEWLRKHDRRDKPPRRDRPPKPKDAFAKSVSRARYSHRKRLPLCCMYKSIGELDEI